MLLLNGAQVAEALGNMPRLAAMARDRVLQRQRSEIVHIPRSRAQTPQWGRAQLVGGILRWSLHDAITRLDVMQQEVAERMNDLASQRLGHEKRAAVDDRPCRGRRDGLDVAGVAADLLEQGPARAAGHARRQSGVAQRDPCAADELSEVVDIRQAEVIRGIFGDLV